MVMCFAPDCKHYSEQKTCSFFRFPKDPALCRKWITLIRREDKSPTPYSLLCSCHFVNGEKKNLPTIFKHNEKKMFRFQSPEKKTKRVRTLSNEAKEITKIIEADKNPSSQNILRFQSSTPPSTSESYDPGSGPSTSTSHGFLDSETGNSYLHIQDNIEKLTLRNPNTEGATKTDNTESRVLSAPSVQQDAEMYFLRKENEMLKQKLGKSDRFSFDFIKNDDMLVHMYTGLPNSEIFECMFSLFANLNLNYYQGWTVGIIPKKDQLLLTLMKLRLNLLHNDLACRFNCSQGTVTNIVLTWIEVIHEILFCQLMSNIPTRHKNKQCMPACFSTFTNCRIVLDCTEVKCIKPISLDKQKSTYSSYKHQNTVKGLIGVAPNGVITFVSDLYPGSVSDKKIVEDSGILSKMEAGDLVIADKGFLISDILPQGVSLNIPPFLTTPQFTPQQVLQTRTIARARIHVERAIRRIKCFSILDSIPQNLFPQSTKIFQVCAAITNLQFPLIAEVESLYKIT